MGRRLALLGLLAATSGVAGAGTAGAAPSPSTPAERLAAAGCRPGAEPSRRYGERPPERHLRYGSRPVVIGCINLPQAGQIELVGYQLGVRRPSLCIDQVERGGLSHGCGTDAVLGGGPIDATGSIGRTRIEGATTADVASVLVRYELDGEVQESDASLVRVRNRPLLRRLRVSRAFGHYLAEVPPGARAVQVEARDADGRGLGVAGNNNFGPPEGEGRRCLSQPTITRLRVLRRSRTSRQASIQVRVSYPNGSIAGIRVDRGGLPALIAHPPATQDGAARSRRTITLPVQLGRPGKRARSVPIDVIADGVAQDTTCPAGIRRSAPRTVSVRIR